MMARVCADGTKIQMTGVEMMQQEQAEGGLVARVHTVRDLLADKLHEKARLRIPDYQRPYKWEVRNVAQLIDDVDQFRRSGRYRIGTVIVHLTEGEGVQRLDIVDGQQRFTTLALLAHYLKAEGLGSALESLEVSKNGLEITSKNITNNYRYIRDVMSRRTDDEKAAFSDFLLDRCEIVVLTLDRADEAFQMFDSQNTRGRALYPTDLLKAFHIREMGSEHVSPELRRDMVTLWESIPPRFIDELFSDYLFKIKRWANGRSVPDRGFATADIDMFKGIRESDPANASNRWAMPFLYAKNYTDDFAQENGTLIRYGAMAPVDYPFQIDQPVINGEIFFKMVAHYYELGQKCGFFPFHADDSSTHFDSLSTVKELDEHLRDPRYAYVRNLIDCLLLYYVDRFEEQELKRAADLISRHVLALRVVQRQVKRITINNYALGSAPDTRLPSVNLFQELREALRATDFLRRPLTTLEVPFDRYRELEKYFSAQTEAS